MSVLVNPYRFASWKTVFSQTLPGVLNGYHQYTFGQVIEPSLWAVPIAAGTKIRATFRSNANGGLAVNIAAFARQKGASGDDRYGYLTAPDQFLFGGSPGFSIVADSEITSDDLTLANVPPFDTANPYVFRTDFTDAGSPSAYPAVLAVLAGATNFGAVVSDALAQSPTGFTTGNGGSVALAAISKIEVFG